MNSNKWAEIHDTFLRERDIELSDYQKKIANLMCESADFRYQFDPGVRRIPIIIRKIDFLIAHSEKSCRILILAPKSIIGYWVDELKKYSMYSDELNIVHKPSELKDDCHNVLIMPYANYRRICDEKWDLFVYEETRYVNCVVVKENGNMRSVNGNLLGT